MTFLKRLVDYYMTALQAGLECRKRAPIIAPARTETTRYSRARSIPTLC